ncbi:MAG: efflux RND transporter periplasmic adaptor subunit [Candidatus Omnitrophota bacterium]
MKKKNIFITIVSILLFFTMSLVLYAQHEGHQMQSQTKKEETVPKIKKPTSKKAVYYCPMHPNYTSDKPGDCPICNMTLVAKEEQEEQEEAPKDSIKIDSYKQQLIGVKTDKVTYRSLIKQIITVGRVAFDPELYKTQQEYIQALKTLEGVGGSNQREVVEKIEAIVEAARLKLELSGMSKEQIEELAKNKESDESLLISTPDSSVTWVYATIYEYELESVKIGQKVSIKAISYPDKKFEGEIVAIDPVFDTMTRSVRSRIKVDNKEGLLKPNMYVDVQIDVDLGAHLAIPKEAIMDSGLRKIVFVSLPDGYFKPVEVRTSISTGDYVQIIEGLKEGDIVVTSGNFLIDSESKLKQALEGTGHQHGQ